ncbi:hypothetical protein [Sphingomonas sp.]|uniref:hypothetical protein n=1 Tax=Sphingomonas sp. TaxID=28214 RepID=UPI001B10B663|nr:hypothetical protein [Sphingomonas sp.]MBO9713232.1 hypothetical protein [Sphingomonas sp.]
MKFANLFACGAATALVAGQALAGPVVQSGDVTIVRDGKVIAASASTALRQGDRLVSRDGATIAFEGCTMTLEAGSVATVSGEGCRAAVKSLSLARADVAMTGASAMKGSSWLVALLALTAVVGGALAAGGKNKPASP